MKQYPFLDLADTNAPYRDRLAEAAARVIASGRYVGGPENEAFEARMATLTGATTAVGVSNGLDALRLSLRAAILNGRLRPGDAVAVAANTYIASVLAITDAGLVPVLVDPDEATMNLGAEGLARAVEADPSVRAVMTVHLYGRVAWDADIADLVARRGLFVIEDVAQAIGARACCQGVDGRSTSAGALGHIAAFSFYPTKNIGALGDAGAVTTSDPELAATVRALANYGSDRRYHNILAGFNCRLDPMQAAFLNVKLPDVDAVNAARRRKAEIYCSSVTLPGLILPPLPAERDTMVWHQFVVRHPERDSLRQWLADRGVATDIHYAVPPHLQPCYARLAHGPLPVTERLAAEVVSLPIAESTSPADAAAIAAIINSFKS